MKRILLFIFALPIFAFGQQVLETETFDTYTLGQVSTDLTAATPGTDGYYVFVAPGSTGSTSTNLDADMAQFVNYNGSQAFQYITPNGDNGYSFTWKTGLDILWSGRATGNDMLRVSFDMTQTTSNASLTTIQAFVYNSDRTKILIGARMTPQDLNFRPVAYYYSSNSMAFGNFFFNLTTPIVYAPNVTSTVQLAFDKATGTATMLTEGSIVNIPGAATGLDPAMFRFYTAALTNNAATDTMVFDNVIISASNAPLSVEDVNGNFAISRIYPNPVKESINIKLAERFDANNTNVTITDMNGRVVKTLPYSESIDANFLSKGVYIINLNDGSASEDQKLIKD